MTSRILAGAFALACLGGAALAANAINTVQNTPTAVECVNDASGVGVGPWAHCQVIVDPATGQPIKPLTSGGAVTATPAALPTAGPTTLGALNAAIAVAASQSPAISFETGSSAFTGTISFQAQVNTAWISVLGYPVGGGAPVSSVALSGTPAANAWVVLNKGYTNVRAIVTAYTSGSIVANAASSQSGDSPIGETAAQPNYVQSVSGNGAVVAINPTVQNAAYGANASLGGWQQVVSFRTTAQPSGLISEIAAQSKSGQTAAITIYGYRKSSAGLTSTCTDKTTFVESAADAVWRIPGFPVTLYPVTTPGSAVAGAAQPAVAHVSNADGTATQNLTFCLVTNAAQTPPTISDYAAQLALAQD